MNAGGGSFSFELKFYLYCFRTSQANLMNDRDLAVGGIAEQGSTAILLTGHVIPMGG